MNRFSGMEKWLPKWGPYSKKYMGVAKIVDEAPIPGARFDCVVHPAQANAGQPAPNVTFPSGFHVWEAMDDLSYFSYRVELEWRDRVYADVSISKIDEDSRLIRTEYVNNTEMDQNCVLNYHMAMEYPWKLCAKVSCDKEFVWKKMVEYDEYEYNTKRSWDHLMPDGLHKGEFFDEHFTDGRGCGDRTRGGSHLRVRPTAFGDEAGDYVTVSITPDKAYDQLSFRYQTVGCNGANYHLTVVDEEHTVHMDEDVTFPLAETLTMISFPIKAKADSKLTITLTSLGESGIEFDFVALNYEEAPVKTEVAPPNFVPECTENNGTWELKYEGVPETIAFRTWNDKCRLREFKTGTLEDAAPSRVSQPSYTFDWVTRPFTKSFKEKHSDDGFFKTFIVHTIFIPAYGKHIEYAVIGSKIEREYSAQELEEIYLNARKQLPSMGYTKNGSAYEFSNRILQATLLTNVVYPTYLHGDWIKHHTPGKRWDTHYTWDSGFIGLGLLERNPELAKYVLDVYLSTEDNKDYAFLMHGSPVPVQVYLFLELMQRTESKEELFAWYPRMKRYYSFLAGKAEGSTTNPFKSGLTTTFDYFYNCSGMDDLPPQVAMFRKGMQAYCAPAITSSQSIRMAKILKMIANEFGLAEDVAEYEQDIACRTEALRKYSWDEESGYFSYVVHDKEGNPVGIFRTDEGENFAKGMEGVYPLIAGACTEEQRARLMEHLFSEKEMFSKVGISSVDMTASYFEPNGYWNGNVWFAHQWFMWKRMLDMGEMDKAYKIAKTALEAWKKEVDYTYSTFELLNIETGRGGWFHQFGGLSSPINIWTNAYFKPGTISCGYEMWISKRMYDEATGSFEVEVTNYSDFEAGMIFVTSGESNKTPEAWLNGEKIPVVLRSEEVAEVRIPKGINKGTLILKA